MTGYLVSLLTMAAIYGVAALGLNLQFGIAGLFNVGCVGFFAVGAYAAALLPGWLSGLLAGTAAAVVLGVLVAGLVLRLRGDTLAIATFGLAVAVQIAAVNLGRVTGGPGGIAGIVRPFGGGAGWLAVCLGVVVVAWVGLEWLDRGAWGRALRAVSEDDEAAAAAGQNVRLLRLQAFLLGAGLTGLAGGLYAHSTGFISPQDFLPVFTFQLYAMVIIGGSGRHAGALLGALVVWAVWSGSGQVLGGVLPAAWQAKAGGLRVMLIATALLAMLRWRPEGLWPDLVGRRAVRW